MEWIWIIGIVLLIVFGVPIWVSWNSKAQLLGWYTALKQLKKEEKQNAEKETEKKL